MLLWPLQTDCYNLLNLKGFQKVVYHLANSKCIRWHFLPAHARTIGGWSHLNEENPPQKSASISPELRGVLDFSS